MPNPWQNFSNLSAAWNLLFPSMRTNSLRAFSADQPGPTVLWRRRSGFTLLDPALARSRRFGLVRSLRLRPRPSRSAQPRSLDPGPRMPHLLFSLLVFSSGCFAGFGLGCPAMTGSTFLRIRPCTQPPKRWAMAFYADSKCHSHDTKE
jgi:hypothetical protein